MSGAGGGGRLRGLLLRRRGSGERVDVVNMRREVRSVDSLRGEEVVAVIAGRKKKEKEKEGPNQTRETKLQIF